MNNRHMKYLLMTAAAGVAIAVTAFATPGSGVLSATVFARANFQDPVDLKFKIDLGGKKGRHRDDGDRENDDGNKEILVVRKTRETVVQQIVLSPGGQTGWHSHPGPVIVLIKTGALTFYDGDDPTCGARTYTAGQSFIDSGQGHVHIAKNESASENLELWAVYFDVPPGGAFRTDVPAPGNCAF
jgi:quercetin dioxygenase-like cupin family protein